VSFQGLFFLAWPLLPRGASTSFLLPFNIPIWEYNSIPMAECKELKPVHDERYWTHQLRQVQQRAELKMAKELKQITTQEEE
jgi:hypothetical protein